MRTFSSEIFWTLSSDLAGTENFERFRARASGIRNSAVYEIPDLLEGILSAGRTRRLALGELVS